MSLSLAPLVEQLLTWIAEYGLGALGLSIFLAAAGLPLPGTLFVIAAGAFVRQGVLDPVWTPLCVLGCVMLGDVVSYGIGRFARAGIERRFGRRRTWVRAKGLLLERGATAIYLTRWMLTPFAAPTSLAAGGGGYPFGRFLAVDLLGELTWLLLFGGLGYAFGSQWEAVASLAGDLGGLLVGIVFLSVGVCFLLGIRLPRSAARRAARAERRPRAEPDE